MQGAIVAAPASNQGKTCVTLGLIRALCNAGYSLFCAKAGPDYIDRAYLDFALTSNETAWNLDPWAMSEAQIRTILAQESSGKMAIIEGVMGLFDGAIDTPATTAQLVKIARLPVILVVSAKGVGASICATIQGFCQFDSECPIKGVIINHIASARHETMIRAAMKSHLPDLPILAMLPSDDAMILPARHLGLVQACELDEADGFYEKSAAWLRGNSDWQALLAVLQDGHSYDQLADDFAKIPPLGQRICVVHDQAFAFTYQHILADWRKEGAQIDIISALNDDAVPQNCDALYLPGGYPELHLPTLAGNDNFRQSVMGFARAGKIIYGECGGFMVLGEAIIDGSGQTWPQLGLLSLVSDMQRAKRQLGYRSMVLREEFGAWPKGLVLRGHEFHYAYSHPCDHGRFIDGYDVQNIESPIVNARIGNVAGSFFHMLGSL